jgi:hypothetical protein
MVSRPKALGFPHDERHAGIAGVTAKTIAQRF